MSAAMPISPRRRGACPGLSAPMATGDGLLVRLQARDTIPLAGLTGMCAAARANGNGVIEITSRGSIQLRGLSERSAPRFAEALAALGIAAADGVPIHCNALAGLDATEILDVGGLAAALREALTDNVATRHLAPKTAIAIDGGGALNLANLAADIRLCAEVDRDEVALRLAIGGDEASATDLGMVKPAHGVAAVLRLIDLLADRGRDARARDILAAEGTARFRNAVADCIDREAMPRAQRRSIAALGSFPLRHGSLAYGVSLAFGHADAATLERLTEAAGAAGADGFRIAPDRTLLAIGISPPAIPAFTVAAERLGFVVRADDPRRRVVACPGAPFCASSQLAARVLAPRIAAIIAARRDGAFGVHLSGCVKGCAQAGPAALTIVGTPEGCALIADGKIADASFALAPEDALLDAVADYVRSETATPVREPLDV